MATVRVNHEHSYFHHSSSLFKHIVLPLKDFLLEQLSFSLLLFFTCMFVRLYRVGKKGKTGVDSFNFSQINVMAFDIVLPEKLMKQKGPYDDDMVLIGLLWCIVYNLIGSNSLRSRRSTFTLRNRETQSFVPYDRQ